MTNIANVTADSGIVYVNAYSNSSQTVFSTIIPVETINVSLNTSSNIQAYNVISAADNVSVNISIPAVNVVVVACTTTNTFTHVVTPVSGGPSYNITTPFVAPVNFPGAISTFNFANFASQPSVIQLDFNATEWNNNSIWVAGAIGSQHQAGAAWYKTQVNIQTFSTQFTFQMPGNTIPQICGMGFVIQNSNVATDPYGGPPVFGSGFGLNAGSDANLCGFGGYSNQFGIGNSIAVKFDMDPHNSDNPPNLTYPPGSLPNETGLFTNGGPGSMLATCNDLNPYGINLYLSHIMQCNIVYDGVYLTMTLLDTITNAQARYIWAINIPYWCISNYAWIGFTAGEIPALPVQIHSWSFQEGYNPRLDTPMLSLANGQYASAQTVSIIADPGATIYYTTNGLLPTTSSTQYTTPITVNSNTILQALAVLTNFTDSYIALGNYQINSANIINYSSGFTPNTGIIPCGYTYANGSAMQLMDQTGNLTVSSLWYAAPVNIQTFTTNFQIVINSNNTGSGYGLGMVFVIQNQPKTSKIPSYSSNSNYATQTISNGVVTGGPTALGNLYQSLGYGNLSPGTLTGNTGGILSSVGIKFDAFNNSTQLYTNGVLPINPDISLSPVIITNTSAQTAAGHPMNVTISYDGSNVSLTIFDTVSSTTFNHVFTNINIPALVGGNTAYVGFTASCGFFFSAMKINNWTFS